MTTAGAAAVRLSSWHSQKALRDRRRWPTTATSTDSCSAIHIASSALSATPARLSPGSVSARSHTRERSHGSVSTTSTRAPGMVTGGRESSEIEPRLGSTMLAIMAACSFALARWLCEWEVGAAGSPHPQWWGTAISSRRYLSNPARPVQYVATDAQRRCPQDPLRHGDARSDHHHLARDVLRDHGRGGARRHRCDPREPSRHRRAGGGGRIARGDRAGPARARLPGELDRPLLQEPRARLALLLRRLRARPEAHRGSAPSPWAPRLGHVAGARVYGGHRAPLRRPLDIDPLQRAGGRDDRGRHPHPRPLRPLPA